MLHVSPFISTDPCPLIQPTFLFSSLFLSNRVWLPPRWFKGCGRMRVEYSERDSCKPLVWVHRVGARTRPLWFWGPWCTCKHTGMCTRTPTHTVDAVSRPGIVGVFQVIGWTWALPLRAEQQQACSLMSSGGAGRPGGWGARCFQVLRVNFLTRSKLSAGEKQSTFSSMRLLPQGLIKLRLTAPQGF